MTALYDIVVLRKQDHPFPYLMLLCRIGGGSEVIMKKRIFSALLAVSLVIALGSFITACKDTDKAVDYSDFAFTKTDWIRETEVCTETLHLSKDGSLSYSFSCGNPVNDADLIEGYTYDDSTKTITFKALETTEDMVTKVKVVSCSDEKLVLDFDGEKREFVPEDKYVHTEEVDYNEFSFTNMDWKREIDGCTEIINFGPFGSFSYYCLCRDHKDYSTVAEFYTYDSEAGTVTLEIISEDENIADTIKIVSYDNEKLIIEYDGETLEFIPG